MISPTGRGPQAKRRSFREGFRSGSKVVEAEGKPVARSIGGFTLIELLLVIAILLTLVAVSAPRFRRTFTGLEADNFALNLVELMRYAHARAVTDGAEYRIRFDTRGSKYWLERREPSKGEKAFRPIRSRFAYAKTIPRTASIDIEAKWVTFFPDGSSDGAEFNIMSGKKIRYELAVLQATSDVRLVEK